MTEYSHVERPFLQQLENLRWETIDQGKSKCEVGSRKFEGARADPQAEKGQCPDFKLQTSPFELQR
jgi:hypothetical protein